MKTCLRELFFSDACEYSHLRKTLTREKVRGEEECEAVLEEMEKSFTPENLALLERYKECCDTVKREDEFYAFICGVRMTLKALIEIF